MNNKTFREVIQFNSANFTSLGITTWFVTSEDTRTPEIAKSSFKGNDSHLQFAKEVQAQKAKLIADGFTQVKN